MLRNCQEECLSPKQVALMAKTQQQGALTASCALAANTSLHLALIAGAIFDQKLGIWMRYMDLINHLDLDIRKLWSRGSEKELGRICQGHNETKGKDVLRFIRKDKVPADKPVTYPRCTV